MARLKALEAAEKRAKASRVLGSGGRLGGVSRTAGMSPRELAARVSHRSILLVLTLLNVGMLQAAEQRMHDEKSCASGADAEREAAKAAKSSVVNNVIDLTLSSDEEDHDHPDVMVVKDVHPRPDSSTKASARPQPSNNKPTSQGSSSKPSVPASSHTRTTASSQSASIKQPANLTHRASKETASSTTGEWSCLVCTLLNPAHALQCDACATRRPFTETIQKSKQGDSWSCLTCGETGMPHHFWTCSWCGTVKLTS